MSDPKKASDVLLELDAKVDTILGMVQLYDTNLKLILNKVNQTHAAVTNLIVNSNLSDLQKTEIQQQLAPLQNSNVVDVPKGVPIRLATEFPGQRRLEPRNISEPNTQVQFTERAPEPAPAPPPISSQDLGRKIPVTQRIQDLQKRDLFMADVTILSMNKDIVAKVKTNALGKWNAVLSPGKYIVSISKTDPTTKQRFGDTQEIVVNGSEKICSLPLVFLDRSKHVI